MLLTITTTYQPATDLGFLLAKNPARVQQFSVPYGQAYVFYTDAHNDKCTAVLWVDLDPVELVRGKGNDDGVLAQYVNDRPYTASSFLTVAMARVFSSALAGHSKERPDLAQTPIPLQVHLPVIRSHQGEEIFKRCFEPLGYTVEIKASTYHNVVENKDEESGYFALTLSATTCLQTLLLHLYVLIPAIDGNKHYFINDDEVTKLIDKSKSWLGTHPEREWITTRYLKKQRSLVRQALERLLEDSPGELETYEQSLQDNVQDDLDDGTEQQEAQSSSVGLPTDNNVITPETSVAEDKPLSLNQQRLKTVYDILVKASVHSVADVGCGEGRLLRMLLKNRQFTKILGMDVSTLVLEKAYQRLKLDRLPLLKQARIELVQGSLTYRDARLSGFDALCAVEVIEHIDPERIAAFEQTIFAFAKPSLVLITSPNQEYNIRYENMKEGAKRHTDHRFEWTRNEFQAWALHVCKAYDYEVTFMPIGEVDPEVGPSTQLGIFKK